MSNLQHLSNLSVCLRALRTVDELVQKIEFEGSTVSITSRHLALGIAALNTSTFNGTSFSASVPPNATDPQVTAQTEAGDTGDRCHRCVCVCVFHPGGL